ncbi:MAG: 2-amino-4-hydroxy-6-hydroxymethyldihydropteridine diphosphokinase [Pirellulales bacterium]
MPRCLIALGSNLGDRAAHIAQALTLVGERAGSGPLAASSLHVTRPVGGPAGQQAYFNAVAAFDTALSPVALHGQLQAIEQTLGRVRDDRWGPRTIDLDLLLYGDVVIRTPELTVPHPRFAFRRFVLEPAVEVAPQMLHPTVGWTVEQLLTHLKSAVPYVALVGLPGSGKSALAARLGAAHDGRVITDGPPAERAARAATGPLPAAGPAYARQIEFLLSRAQRLSTGDWASRDQLAVSDFSFDQTLAYAELALDAADLKTFERAFDQAARQVVLPKLLIVLDTPPALAASVDAAVPRLREKLLALAARRGRGPVLAIGSEDRDGQFAEASAALAAMQPTPHDP